MSIFLHQSNVIFNVNISFADFFCVLILLVFAFQQQLQIPIKPLIFFLVLSALVLATSVFYVPFKFMYYPSLMRIISEYVKLVAIFIYFIIGFNLSKLGYLEKTIRWYSIFGIFIGAIGVLFTLFNIGLFSQFLFFAGIRFRGLMIDPNYFSILQVSALVYLSRAKAISPKLKFIAIIITVLSVIASGSKTGMVTLVCYTFIRIIEYIFMSKKKIKVIVFQLFLIVIFVLLIPLAASFLQNIINSLTLSIPSFARIQYLFTDLDYAIAGNGSGRDNTWNVALEIIKLSPIIGTGIGTYTNIGFEMFQLNNVAHNTFLQLSAEWGVPTAFILFSYVFFILLKATSSRVFNSEINLILRDIIIILLIGSVAISLNNARMLWLFLGALVYSVSNGNTYRKN